MHLLNSPIAIFNLISAHALISAHLVLFFEKSNVALISAHGFGWDLLKF